MMRTDFENMPIDGSRFFALVYYPDRAMAYCEVVYRNFKCLYEEDREHVRHVDGSKLLRSDDPELHVIEDAHSESLAWPNAWFRTFWYTDTGCCSDREHGTHGDSLIHPSRIIGWCVPDRLEVADLILRFAAKG